jgi:hypothetical protein
MQQTSDSAPRDGAPRLQDDPTAAGGRWLSDRLRGELWRDAFSIAILALAAAIFFWPVITGRAWLPKGGGDSVSFLYPMYRFAADSLRGGTIPFWNPYQYAGSPFLSDNQSGIFILLMYCSSSCGRTFPTGLLRRWWYGISSSPAWGCISACA